MNLKNLIFVLLIHLGANAQQIKPKQGKIEFVVTENPYTSIPVIFLGDTLPRVISQKYVFEFKNDSIIESYKIMSTDKLRENRGSSTFINTRQYSFNNSSNISNENKISKQSYDHSNLGNDIVQYSIKKFRNEQKKILSYDCYRVEILESKQLDSLTTEKTYYDLFVTEDIKCEYHPILKHKTFLLEFYPLEITSRKELLLNKKRLTEKDKNLKLYYDEVLSKRYKSNATVISIF